MESKTPPRPRHRFPSPSKGEGAGGEGAPVLAPRPRRRFQLHLSTCIVIMLAAGAVMYINSVPLSTETYGIITDQWGEAHRIEEPTSGAPEGVYFQAKRYGFPEIYLRAYDEVKFKKGKWVPIRDTNMVGPSTNQEMRVIVFFDLLIGLGAVIASAFAAELLARRFAAHSNRQS